MVMGAESWTEMVASEATLVAPVAGVVETTLRGGAAMVVEWPEGGVARWPEPWLWWVITTTPATMRATITMAPAIQAGPCRLGGGTSIL